MAKKHLKKPTRFDVFCTFVACGFFFVGCSGAYNAGLYWWVKANGDTYQKAELVVTSGAAFYENQHHRLMQVHVNGKIGGQSVSGSLRDVFKGHWAHPNEELLKLIASRRAIPVFWNGQARGEGFLQGRSSNFVEADFILHPPAEVWWAPLTLLLAAVFLILQKTPLRR